MQIYNRDGEPDEYGEFVRYCDALAHATRFATIKTENKDTEIKDLEKNLAIWRRDYVSIVNSSSGIFSTLRDKLIALEEENAELRKRVKS